MMKTFFEALRRSNSLPICALCQFWMSQPCFLMTSRAWKSASSEYLNSESSAMILIAGFATAFIIASLTSMTDVGSEC